MQDDPLVNFTMRRQPAAVCLSLIENYHPSQDASTGTTIQATGEGILSIVMFADQTPEEFAALVDAARKEAVADRDPMIPFRSGGRLRAYRRSAVISLEPVAVDPQKTRVTVRVGEDFDHFVTEQPTEYFGPTFGIVP